MLDAVSISKPTAPLSSPSPDPKLPTRSLQDGISSLTPLSTPQKVGLLLGLLSVGAFLVFIFRKFFSNPLKEFPIELQLWVTENFKGWKTPSQILACKIICNINNGLKNKKFKINPFFNQLDIAVAKNRGRGQETYNQFKNLIILYVRQTYPQVYIYTPESDEVVLGVFLKQSLGPTYCQNLVRLVREIESRDGFLQDPLTYLRERPIELGSQIGMETLALEHYFNPRLEQPRLL